MVFRGRLKSQTGFQRSFNGLGPNSRLYAAVLAAEGEYRAMRLAESQAIWSDLERVDSDFEEGHGRVSSIRRMDCSRIVEGAVGTTTGALLEGEEDCVGARAAGVAVAAAYEDDLFATVLAFAGDNSKGLWSA